LALGALLVVTAAIRGALIVYDLPALSHDSHLYMQQAAAIRAGRWDNIVANGYPLLLAAIPYDIGSTPFILFAQALNMLFAGGTTLLTFATARRLAYETRPALAAAALVALWPHQINYARFVLTECVVTFAIALAVWATVSSRSVLAGAALGACGLIRTTYLPVMVAVPVLAAANAREAVRTLGVAVATLAIFVAAALPSGHIGLGTDLPASLEIARTSEDGNYHFDVESPSFGAALSAYVVEAQASPLRFAKQRLQALNELWGPWPIEKSRDTASRLLIGLRFPFVLLGLVGWWHLRSRQAKWATAIPIVTITLVHVALFSLARFSQPAEPQVLLLAVGGFVRITHND